MTKAELVNQVAQTVNISRSEADTIVTEVLDSIVQSLRDGDSVEFRGFGSFRIRTRPARMGRNPKSGETVEVPSKTIPFFKAAKQLRDAVADAKPADG